METEKSLQELEQEKREAIEEMCAPSNEFLLDGRAAENALEEEKIRKEREDETIRFMTLEEKE